MLAHVPPRLVGTQSRFSRSAIRAKDMPSARIAFMRAIRACSASLTTSLPPTDSIEAHQRPAVDLAAGLEVLHRVGGALDDDLPLPLADRRQDVQDQPAGSAAGVDVVSDRHQRGLARLAEVPVDQLAEIDHATGQAVELADQQGAGLAPIEHAK